MKYIEVKIIDAVPMTDADAYDIISARISLRVDGAPRAGYKIVYQGGYSSWISKERFEESDHRPTKGMTIGLAIEAVRKGEKIARTGWDVEGMFLYHVKANSYPVSGSPGSAVAGLFPDDMVPYGEYLAMKTAQGNILPWQLSQADILMDDWQVV